jgi:DNA-binding response OmpR family regulator
VGRSDARCLIKSGEDGGWASEVGLVVAADFDAAGKLSDLLRECGYYCSVARRDEGLRAIGAAAPNFVVIDHEASDLDGWSLLIRVREITSVPIVVIADESIGDLTVEALDLGASAFLGRPVNQEELCLRVARALRRSSADPRRSGAIQDQFFQIDLIEKRAWVLEMELDLTATEFRFLVALATRPGEALSHEQIVELVWPDGFRELDQVKLNVSYLRRAVKEVAAVDPIVTVAGIGYRYEPRHTD